MGITRWLIAGGAVAATSAGLLFGGVFDGANGKPSRASDAAQTAADAAGVTIPRSPSPGASVAGVLDLAADGIGASDTAGLIGSLQARLREQPDDVESLGLLGLAYQQRARETGDPSFYAKAEGVLEDAAARDPDDLTVRTGLGSLALARHEFTEALELGEQARRLAPDSARPYGIIGDALLELGRYDEAFAAFDRMAALKPSAGAYARISYARELLGDLPGAIEAMQLALDAAVGAAEPYAWTSVQLGKLHFQTGALDEAQRAYRDALDRLPGYPFALEAEAELSAARGDLAGAVALGEQAVAAVPLPQFVALLGDLYAAAGDEAGAAEQDALMGALIELFEANGVRTDLETALFYADRDIELERALELARRGQAERPSVLGDDTLAWVLERNGRCQEARAASERALRLGSRDGLVFFHRGMIERCLGDEAAAVDWFSKALQQNPHFSVRWAPLARQAVAAGARSEQAEPSA